VKIDVVAQLNLKSKPFALSAVSIANGVEALSSFDFDSSGPTLGTNVCNKLASVTEPPRTGKRFRPSMAVGVP
jgi:hypothetical protein